MAKKIVRVKGLIIRASEFGEADKGITLFTESGEKIELIVKGIMKSKRREKSAVDVMSVVEIVYYKGANYNYVSEISLISFFDEIRSDIFKIGLASYILKLISYFALEGEKNIKLYKRTIKAMNYIDRENSREKELIMILSYITIYLNDEGVLDVNFIKESKMKNDEKKVLVLLKKVDIMELYRLKLKEKYLLGLFVFFEDIFFCNFDLKIKINKFII